MDPLLSLLMANLALVKENDVVLDPFVGTGSILIAAGVLNAYVAGNDIDYLMVHAKNPSSRAFTVRFYTPFKNIYFYKFRWVAFN